LKFVDSPLPTVNPGSGLIAQNSTRNTINMAKKQDPKAETKEKPDAPAGDPKEKKGKEPKEGKEPRAKEGKEPKDAKEPKEAREPKKGKAKTSPEAPAPEGAPAAPAGEAKVAPAAKPGEPKKKGKAPGRGPSRGKKLKGIMQAHQQKLLKDGPAPVQRGVQLLKQMKRAKFDETVEVHMSLGIDPAQSDQAVRGSVSLPHGLGKTKRVVVFCQGDNLPKAKEAGADFAGADDLIEKIQKEGWLDFDVALATQDMMGKVSRLGKVLGPRGLMPTPKAGTVVAAGQDIAQAVREQKAGKVEYRTDKSGNVHAGIGKMSFDEEKLVGNITAFVDQVRAAKPAGVKGNFVKSITLSATMSPGIRITV
jgi:large subunit ribosomal protein L1